MKLLFAAVGCCLAGAASADDAHSIYSLAGLYSEDGAYSTHAAADLGLTAKSTLTFDAGYSHSPQELADTSTYRGGVAFDRDFKPIGTTIGYEYWGDRERITSHGIRGTIYAHGDAGRVAFTYQRRNITFDFDVPPAARGFVDNSRTAHSDGYGVNVRFDTKRVDFYANGMDYRYDINLSRLGSLIDASRLTPQQRADLLARVNLLIANLGRLNASSLTLANSLLDYNFAGGVDVRVGHATLNLELARDVAATDGVTLNSASIGFTHPLGSSFDVEYRIGGSDGNNVSSTVFGGVTIYWYR